MYCLGNTLTLTAHSLSNHKRPQFRDSENGKTRQKERSRIVSRPCLAPGSSTSSTRGPYGSRSSGLERDRGVYAGWLDKSRAGAALGCLLSPCFCGRPSLDHDRYLQSRSRRTRRLAAVRQAPFHARTRDKGFVVIGDTHAAYAAVADAPPHGSARDERRMWGSQVMGSERTLGGCVRVRS